MISFKDDYSEGAHENILQALLKSNTNQEPGYGMDSHTLSAIDKIKKLTNKDVDVHLISGGTQTNLLVIGSFLRPHEACIAANTGHIAVHETGAIEHTGHKVITVASSDGKLTPQMIESALSYHLNEHMVKPKMVYISNPTEIGTHYDQNDLKAISALCKEKNLYLYADGARLGTALSVKEANLSLEVMAEQTDAFFIGGTKNGALLGEALVIKNEALKADFRYLIKQKGALLAKGRLLGIQFDQLFTDDLFFKLADHANTLANKLQNSIQEMGYDFLIQSKTNQIFPILKNETIEALNKDFAFYTWQAMTETTSAIRLVTSWATDEKNVDAFIKRLKDLS